MKFHLLVHCSHRLNLLMETSTLGNSEPVENMAMGLARTYFACESLKIMVSVDTYVSIPGFLDPSILARGEIIPHSGYISIAYSTPGELCSSGTWLGVNLHLCSTVSSSQLLLDTGEHAHVGKPTRKAHMAFICSNDSQPEVVLAGMA